MIHPINLVGELLRDQWKPFSKNDHDLIIPPR